MKLFNIRKVMVLVSVCIHEGLSKVKIKKIDYFGKYKVKRTESWIF